ncbi:methyltransferase domain-containing protein [Streptomyces sp. NPDC003077]|uniref:methyltransferase domain-containing protein n=1 Tax=Streptomyces sp. NPDC003077 TaxID=3154443 RepID=UPI0033ACEBE3
MSTAAELRARCAAAIDAYGGPGHFNDRPWLRETFLRVPREHFAPERVWWHKRDADGRYPVLDRATEPGRWLEAVYTPDAPLITQIADGAVRVEDGPSASNEFTSSLSAPSVVVDMLHYLDPRPGDHILEIGTGTGYSTALLADRIGPTRTTTVEIDDRLAAEAEERLRALGHDLPVHVADGEQGYAPRAPYDRLISTVGVRRIPLAWLDQVRAGGVLVTPLDTPFGQDALAYLECDGHGGAQGNLVTALLFMKARGQRQPVPWRTLGWPRLPDFHVTVGPAAGPAGQRIRTRP